MVNKEIQVFKTETSTPNMVELSNTHVNIENIIVDENSNVLEGAHDLKIVQYQAWVDENGNGSLDGEEAVVGYFTDNEGKSALDFIGLNPEDEVCAQQLRPTNLVIPQIDRECEVIGDDYEVNLSFKNVLNSPIQTPSPTPFLTVDPETVNTLVPVEFPNTGGVPENDMQTSPTLILGLALASIGALSLNLLRAKRK